MANSGSGIQIQIQPRNGISTVSSSTSLPTTLNNGLSSSPMVPASNTSPIASRSQPSQLSQPEQIIVPVGNVLNSSKSHSESSFSSSRGQSSSSQNAVSPSPGSSDTKTVLDRTRLRELVKEVDPLEQMDDDVQDVLLQVADDFIENVVTASCQLAKHRKSNTLETKDVQLYLEKCWNMHIPGFGSDEIKPFKKSMATEAHKQRLALIRKTLKKC